VCAHPDPALARPLQHATLATVALDVADRDLRVTPGGPCNRPAMSSGRGDGP
jgi:hypothetical protein